MEEGDRQGRVIAVVDTGVALTHPDLRGRVLPGRDYIAPGTSPADENGHGSHVAGIIAANANNKVGTAGLAHQSLILPVRVLDRDGSGDSADVAQGIVWAAQHGANVINLSLGANRSDNAIKAAVAYAQSRNVVVVAAAGNDGCGLVRLADGLSGGLPGSARRRRHLVQPQDRELLELRQLGRRRRSRQRHRLDDHRLAQARVSAARAARCTARCRAPRWPRRTSSAAAALEIARLKERFNQASIVSRLQSAATDLGRAGRDNSYGYGLINPSRLLAGR